MGDFDARQAHLAYRNRHATLVLAKDPLETGLGQDLDLRTTVRHAGQSDRQAGHRQKRLYGGRTPCSLITNEAPLSLSSNEMLPP